MPEPIKTKQCCRCNQIKKPTDFYTCKKSADNYQSFCKVCNRIYQKSYQTKFRKTEKGKAYTRHYHQTPQAKAFQKLYEKTEKRKASKRDRARKYYCIHLDRMGARNAIKHLIATGIIPKAKELQCHYCDSHAKEYHHHKGYACEHWLDVVPACKKCHTKVGVV